MDLKFRTVYAAYCNGTHHKLAMDALFHLRIGEASRWRDMLGVPGGRDADADRIHSRRRTGLPRPEPAPSRQLLCVAAISPAVQAAADDRRRRALLPDRQVLPR